MSIGQPPPPKTLEDYWKEFQAWLSASKQQVNGQMYDLGLTRQQQQNSPTNQWDTSPAPRGYGVRLDDARMLFGDKPVDYLQNKIIPFWQRLTNGK